MGALLKRCHSRSGLAITTFLLMSLLLPSSSPCAPLTGATGVWECPYGTSSVWYGTCRLSNYIDALQVGETYVYVFEKRYYDRNVGRPICNYVCDGYSADWTLTADGSYKLEVRKGTYPPCQRDDNGYRFLARFIFDYDGAKNSWGNNYSDVIYVYEAADAITEVTPSPSPSLTPTPTPTASPPVASFKSLNVVELGRSDEETYDGAHMVGGSIRFDPTASYDADGQIITYEWDFDNGNKFSTDAPNIYDVIFQEARIYNVTLTVTDNDGLTNTFDERLDLTLKEGDLIFIRTAWWNKPFNIVGNDYTHVGMYTEGQWMIESILTGNARSSGGVGVVQTPVSGWSYPSETFATLVRVKTANFKIRQMAVAFAQSKLGQGYDTFVNKKSVSQQNYYCSELVWAAYYKASKGKIDLGNKGKKGGVWPDDIINDAENTKVIGYHWEHNP